MYPRKSKEEIANGSIDTLLMEVSAVLGTTKNIAETKSSKFYERLQGYVDSKEKAGGDKGEKKKKKAREMEYWPLIRVVRYD